MSFVRQVRGSIICGLFCLTTTAVVAQAPPIPSQAQVEGALRRVAEQMNTTLHARLDRATRLDAVIAGPGRRFTYVITVLEGLKVGTTQQDFLKEMTSYSRTSICSDPAIAVFLRDDVVIAAKYRHNSGKHLGEIETQKSDCSR